MNHKTYSIWCSKQGLNPYLKSSQDKWEKWVKLSNRNKNKSSSLSTGR